MGKNNKNGKVGGATIKMVNKSQERQGNVQILEDKARFPRYNCVNNSNSYLTLWKRILNSYQNNPSKSKYSRNEVFKENAKKNKNVTYVEVLESNSTKNEFRKTIEKTDTYTKNDRLIKKEKNTRVEGGRQRGRPWRIQQDKHLQKEI